MDICLRIYMENFYQCCHRQCRMLLSPCVLKSLSNIERIHPRIMCATFGGNPCKTIVSCFSPINASDEMDISTFYNKLSSLAWLIPKQNIVIISGDMNAQIGKDRNNKLCYTICQTEMANI